MENVFDVAIIGAGTAGCTAAIYAARAGLKTCLITESFGGQLLLTSSIENYTGFIKETGMSLAEKIEKHVKSYKEITVKEFFKVKSIKKINELFEIETMKPEKIKSKTIIIASGKKPRKLEVKGAERFQDKGIHYCALCDAPLYKGKTVAVIGGGYAGIEEALYLSEIMKKVFLIHLGSKLEGEEITKKQVLEKAKKGKIEIIYNAKTIEVIGKEKLEALKYQDLKTGKEKELKVEAIFVQIGQIPNTEFIDFLEKNSLGEIIINENNMTSVKGIFAAGDVTNIKVKQAIVSAAEGCKAALNVAKYLKEN